MRIWTNGRGKHPTLANALHQWTLDEANASDNARDLVGAADLTVNNNPTILTAASAAPGGPTIGPACRRFNGTNQYFKGGSGTDAAVMAADWTVVLSFRLSSSFSGTRPLISYGGDGTHGVSADQNYLLDVSVDSNRNIRVAWHKGTGVGVTVTFTKVTLEKSRPYHVVLSHDGARNIDLYIDGGFVETKTATDMPARGGTDQQLWRIGESYYSAAAAYWAGDIDSVTVYDQWNDDTWAEDVLREMKLHGFETAVHWKVTVRNGDGDDIDLSDYYGHDWLSSVEITGDVDTSVETIKLTLWKQIGELSLALQHNNPANRLTLPSAGGIGVDDQSYSSFGASGSTELLTPKRVVQAYCCRLPHGISPSSTDWQLRFDGYLDTPEWGDDSDKVTVEAHDKSVQLSWAQIWDVAKKFGPGLVEDVMQDILDYGNATTISTHPLINPAMTLAVKGTPAWTLSEYTQERVAFMDALRKLAAQMGWGLRTMWDYATMAYAITLFEPDRLRKHPDVVLDDPEYLSIPSAKYGLDSVRNVVRLKYLTTESTGTTVPTIATGTTTAAVGTRGYDGERKGKYTASDGTLVDNAYLAWIDVNSEDLDSTELGYISLTELGPRVMEITESETDGIHDIAQAQAMAVGLLRDLCLPKADRSVNAFQLPELEVNDFIRLRSNLTSTSDQDGAAMTFTHSDEGTTFMVRGMPAGGVVSHLEKEGRPGVAAPPAMAMADIEWVLPDRQRQGILDFLINKVPSLQTAGRHALLHNTRFDRRDFGNRPPNGWRQASGTWGTDADVDTSNALSGRYCLKIPYHATNPSVVVSELATVPKDAVVETLVKTARDGTSGSGTAYCLVKLEWYNSAFTLLSTDTVVNDVAKDTWIEYRKALKAPSTARYFRLRIERDNASGRHVFYQAVEPTIRHPNARVSLNADITSGLTVKTWGTLQLTNTTAPSNDNVGGYYDTATNYRFTAPEPGFYLVTAHAIFDTGGSNTLCQLRLRKAGAELMKSPVFYYADVDGEIPLELNAQIWLDQDESIDLQFYPDLLPGGYAVLSGAHKTYLAVRRIAPD